MNCAKSILRAPMNFGIIFGFAALILLVPLYFHLFAIKKISEKPFRLYARIDATLLFLLGIFIAYRIVTSGYLDVTEKNILFVKQVLTGELSTTDAQVKIFHQ